jgi:radical SAM superfamily enzyme YgiQ (UPF0313 family)
VNVLLVSTYELGRQPFGVASPAAWLKAAGHSVGCADLACGPLPENAVRSAGLVAFHLPMHTATRLAVRAIEKVRQLNPEAHLCCYGLYAAMNEAHLRRLGAGSIIAGEFEPGLAQLADSLELDSGGSPRQRLVAMDRLRFLTPDRSGLPPFDHYAALRINGERRLAGYTEASRGCKHLCRHCPVVPVYGGRFRVVQPEVVLEDIRRQVAAGARHITFGDPDFFNGPAHAAKIVELLHREFPALTYDVTIKIEHLLRHRAMLPLLQRTGCLFVTSAAESVEDLVLTKLDKGHTRADFVRVVGECRAAGLALAPTFVPFTPWTTWTGYRNLLKLIAELDLVESVAPVQLGLRLLIPAGSKLLELPDIRESAEPFDDAALVYRWRHADPKLDQLSARILTLVEFEERQRRPRREIFAKIWSLASDEPLPENYDLLPRAAIPYMDEPWYC